MIMNVNGAFYTVSVVSSSSEYDSGIEWKPIGNTLVPLDRGADSSKYKAILRVKVPASQASYLYSDICEAMRKGRKDTYITTYSQEDVFGPHISPNTYNVIVTPRIHNTDVNNTDFWLGLLDIEIDSIESLAGNYTQVASVPSSSVTDPLNGVSVLSVSRTGGVVSGVLALEESNAISGPLNRIKVSDVVLETTKVNISKFLVYLEALRGNSFTWSYDTTATYLFSPGDVHPACFVRSMRYIGRTDRAGNTHRISITLVRK